MRSISEHIVHYLDSSHGKNGEGRDESSDRADVQSLPRAHDSEHIAESIGKSLISLSESGRSEIVSALTEGRRIHHEQLQEQEMRTILQVAADLRIALRSLSSGTVEGSSLEEMRSQMSTLIRILSQPRTVALMTGSEALTFKRAKEFERKNPGVLEVTGIVATTKDLDNAIPLMVHDIPGINHLQQGFSVRAIPWTEDVSLRGKYHDFQYRHTTAKPGKMFSPERDVFSADAADQVLAIDPDVVVLANMMYVLSRRYTSHLDKNQMRSLGSKTFNIHPSVEPELVGANPELRAIIEGNRRATGFTMHALNALYSDPEHGQDVELDHGTVLCHQRVPSFCTYDHEERRKIGKPYDVRILEMQRIRTMDASSRWVAPVAALYAEATPQTMKVVRGRDAFAEEGRLDFYHSDDYRELLWGEYDDYCKKEGIAASQLSFEEWRSTKHPGYQRALFLDQGEFKTLEEILHIPPEADDTIIHPPTQYDFIVGPEKAKEDALAIFWRFVQLAGGADGEQLLAHSAAENRDFFEQDGKWLLFGSITTTASIEGELKGHCTRIDIRVRHLRIGAPAGVAPLNTVRGYHALLDEARHDQETWAGRS